MRTPLRFWWISPPGGSASYLKLSGGHFGNGYAAWALEHGVCPVFRPVNRIDKDTSGLVLAAKHAYAAPLLAQQGAKALLCGAARGAALGTRRYRCPHRPPGGQALLAAVLRRRANQAVQNMRSSGQKTA